MSRAPVVDDVLAPQPPPKQLDWSEMLAVGRDEVKLDPAPQLRQIDSTPFGSRYQPSTSAESASTVLVYGCSSHRTRRLVVCLSIATMVWLAWRFRVADQTARTRDGDVHSAMFISGSPSPGTAFPLPSMRSASQEGSY
jgi:hypothetical protein